MGTNFAPLCSIISGYFLLFLGIWIDSLLWTKHFLSVPFFSPKKKKFKKKDPLNEKVSKNELVFWNLLYAYTETGDLRCVVEQKFVNVCQSCSKSVLIAKQSLKVSIAKR